MTQSGATWRKSATRISLSTTATPLRELQRKMLSRRTILDRLLNKIDSRGVSKDRPEDRGRPRSASTAANFVLPWRLDMQRGLAESLAGVRHQWMVPSSWMHFAAERRTNQTYLLNQKKKKFCAVDFFIHFNRHVENSIALKCVENYANRCSCF